MDGGASAAVLVAQAAAVPWLSAAIGAAQQVECTNCGPGLLEWIGALAGVVGGVAAVLAWRLAKTSARDSAESADAARRSADAAEAELGLFREEVVAARAERARLARIAVAMSSATPHDMSRDIGSAQFRLAFSNMGTRTAERVVLSVLWPADVPMEPIAGPAWVQPGEVAASLEDLGRGIESCVRWTAVLGPFDANNSYVATLLGTQEAFRASFPVEVRINYDDLPTPDDDVHRFEVVIPEQGDNVQVHPAPGAVRTRS